MQPIPSVPGQAPLIVSQQPLIPSVPQVQALQAFSPKASPHIEPPKDRRRQADEKADERSSKDQSQTSSQSRAQSQSWDFSDFLPISIEFLAQFLAQNTQRDSTSLHRVISLAQAISLYKQINNWAQSSSGPTDPRRPVLFRRSDGSRVTSAI